MKLISCYIEGYGKIKKKEYRFAEGITTFCEENGEGKTTLASFLKSMFYGLKAYRKGSTEFCDREHFYPFDGGLFGGNLTFERKGKIYKIERFFGDKSDTADTVKVYENGEETDVFGEEIGKSIFGVDRESFERTTFLDSGEIEIKSTSAIHAQLNRFLVGGEEDSNVDGATAALEKAAKTYKKSRAGNDRVTVETLRLAKLNEGIENAERIKFALEDKYSRSARLQEEIESVNAQIVQAQAQNERLTQFEHYDSLAEGVERAENALQSIALRYPNGLPSEEETLAVNEYMVGAKELQAKANGAAFPFKDEEKLVVLEEKFRQGIPSEEGLLAREKEIQTVADLETEEKLLKARRTDREERILAKFSRLRPTPAEMEETAGKVEQYKRAKTEYDGIPAWLQAAPQKSSQKGFAVCAAIAVLFCLVGTLGFFVNPVCFVGFVAGIATLFIGGAYGRKPAATLAQENPEKRSKELQIRELEDSVKAVLLPYGYYSGNGLAFDFATLQTDVAEYTRLCEEEAVRAEREKSLRMRIEELTEGLTAFFRAYGLLGDTFVKRLSDLRLAINTYLDLTARKKAAESEGEKIAESLRAVRVKIEGYRSKYSLNDLPMSAIMEDIRSYARLSREVEEGRKKMLVYREEKGLGDRSDEGKADLGALQRLLSDRQSEYGRLQREIASDETDAEKLENYTAEKAQTEERLKEYKRKHKLLSATMELLKKADGRLRDRYVSPIKKEFLCYAEIIEKSLGERVVMTKDFELRFERNGIERSEKHWSSGQRSVCALCFRLALIKNMYREELPFLILDDPFALLDNRHMEKVQEVLKALSKDMQMVYFTCHESRRI